MLALIFCLAALAYGVFSAWCVAASLLTGLVRGHRQHAWRHVLPLLLPASSLGLCTILLGTQPVEWPFNTGHIPFYALSLALSYIGLRILPRMP